MADYKTQYSNDKNINTLNRGSYNDYGDGTPAKQVLAKQAPGEVFDVNLASLETGLEYDIAQGTVSAIKAIYQNTSGVSHGDKDTYTEATIIGISITGNVDGETIKYKTDGRLEDSFFNFPLNDPLYLGDDGAITNVAPTTGHRTRLGHSLGVGAMFIQIEEPIIL